MYGANRPCQLCQLCITICFLITRHFVKVFLFFSWRHRVRLPLSHQCHLSLFLFKSQITPLRDRLSLSLFETHTHTLSFEQTNNLWCVCVWSSIVKAGVLLFVTLTPQLSLLLLDSFSRLSGGSQRTDPVADCGRISFHYAVVFI